MKKLSALFIAFLFLAVSSCSTINQNTGNDLNWEGIYTGTLPGANSDIYTEITLNKDATYKVTHQYVDKSAEVFTYTGIFKWKNNNTIDLNQDGMPSYYIVGKNSLTHLDKDGQKITGRFADMYVLKKKQ
ncbi:MAG: copper resistance protein NlpE [Treponema sp.]|nr:copper resistance protein NlpE [Treponema sp.]